MYEMMTQLSITPYPEMIDALRCLRAEGIKTALLTNNFNLPNGTYIPLDTSLFDIVSCPIVSCNVNFSQVNFQVYIADMKAKFYCSAVLTHIIIKSGPRRLGHSCLHKSVPRISVLRSMPGRVKVNVPWLQVGLNSSGPGKFRATSPPFPIPWRVVDGMKSTAMFHFRASTHYMTNKRSRRERIVSDRGGQPV